jgi:hypothetical protein
MHAATKEAELSPPTPKRRGLLVSRLAMLAYFVGISSAIAMRDPRVLMIGVPIAVIPIVAGPAAYRFIGVFAAIAAFLVCALIQLS